MSVWPSTNTICCPPCVMPLILYLTVACCFKAIAPGKIHSALKLSLLRGNVAPGPDLSSGGTCFPTTPSNKASSPTTRLCNFIFVTTSTNDAPPKSRTQKSIPHKACQKDKRKTERPVQLLGCARSGECVPLIHFCRQAVCTADRTPGRVSLDWVAALRRCGTK